jgi:type IV pilus assembly protein PilC
MPSLRQILSSSLGSILRGKPDGIGPWIARASMLGGPRAKGTPRVGGGAYYRMTRGIATWRGPRYLRKSTSLRDALTLGNELSSLVNANAPLVMGLSVAAKEQRRHHAKSRRISWFMKALIVLGSLVMLEQDANFVTASFFVIAVLWVVPSFLYPRLVRLETVLLVMRDRLASGMEVSDVLASLPRVFPPFYVGLVRAGERSGKLGTCLEGLNATLVRHMLTRQTLWGSFGYLGAVALVQVLLMSFIAVKVYPVFVEILEEFGAAPPAISQTLFATLDYAGSLLFLGKFEIAALIGLLAALCVPWYALRRSGYTRTALVESLLLWVPRLRQVVLKSNLAPAASVLALLTEAGVPLDRALDQAAQLELHPRYRRLFQRLRDGVRQGDALSQCCAKEGRALPGSFGALIGVGEQSGMLPDAFRQLADLYEQDVQHGTRIASDLIMPAGVLVLASLTLWFEVSLFGTVIAMSDAVLGGN